MSKIIDKIVDGIKSFGLSLTSMFKVNDEMDDVSYLDSNSEDGIKLAEEMRPYVDSLNALEAKRNKEQKQYENRLRQGETVDSKTTFREKSDIKNPTQVIKRDGKNHTGNFQQTEVPKDIGDK